MKDESGQACIEPRWPVAVTIIAVVFLLQVLPGRVRVFAPWVAYAMGLLVLVPMGGVWLTAGHAAWAKLERASTVLFVLIAGGGTLVNLATLIVAMVTGSTSLGALQLLTSSIAIWVTNVLAFSLVYWQLDRGGPAARVNHPGTPPDWLFPQEGVPEIAPQWRPNFADYLFLGFATATAFSATDALPLTPRAKMLMMIQSSIALVTIVVVAARSINILGS